MADFLDNPIEQTKQYLENMREQIVYEASALLADGATDSKTRT